MNLIQTWAIFEPNQTKPKWAEIWHGGGMHGVWFIQKRWTFLCDRKMSPTMDGWISKKEASDRVSTWRGIWWQKKDVIVFGWFHKNGILIIVP